MRFLLTSFEYPEFLTWLYQKHPGLEKLPYADQLRLRMETGFLWADFYSQSLRRLGHQAEEVIPQNVDLQLAWARENGVRVSTRRWRFRRRRGWVPWFSRIKDPGWLWRILSAQVRSYRPDVLYVRDIGVTPPEFVRDAKRYARFIVGQHASRFDPEQDYSGYNLILSSLPNIVDFFRRAGLRSEILRLGFEPSILARTQDRTRTIPVSFVGKLADDHTGRAEFLRKLCCDSGVELWGSGVDGLPDTVLRHYRGPAWGLGMFQVLRDSRITINHHESWAGPHANNLRLFEATGVGTLLLTDWKQDLGDLFEPGKEVVVYRSAEECRELAEYYLAHEDERRAIARAGQERTLRDHTYLQRMQELLAILQRRM